MRTLISGGGSDIGRALVERRLALGDEVCITTSKLNNNYSFSKRVESFYFVLERPNEKSEDLQKWLDGGIDCLVLNAASRNSSLRRIDEYLPAEIDAVIDANIKGNIWLLQQCLSRMEKQTFGRIVFISSITVNGSSKYSLYSMSKGAIESLIQGVASDYGEFNITANIIRPGIIETERTKRFWKRTAYVDVMKPLIPLMKFGKPDEIALSTDFFLSKDCYSTGAILNVSGGLPEIRPDSIFKVGL